MGEQFPEWLPYCGVAPAPSGWLASWNLDSLLLVFIATAAIAGIMRSGGRRAWQNFTLLLFALLFVSPLCALGSALFLVRTVHHVLLVTVLAPLLVASFDLHRRKIALSLPVLTAVHVLVFWAWHAPALYSAALSNDAIFWLMQLTITGSAVLWWARLRQAHAGPAVIALLATMVLTGVLGALLTFSQRAFYTPHYLTTQAWGLSPLEDQQVAGILMWVPASAIYLLVAMAILYRAIGPAAIEGRRSDKAA